MSEVIPEEDCSCGEFSALDAASPRGGAVPSAYDSPQAGVAALVRQWQTRPSWDEYFMATALLISSRSACERLHVGCVLVSGGNHRNRLIAAGYNGFLPGAQHVSKLRDGHEQATVHAEQNAITDAARRGISVEGATAYVTHYPCINCAKIMAAAGISEVKYHEDYRNDPFVGEMFAEHGIAISKL